jgi:hypothetical protein
VKGGGVCPSTPNQCAGKIRKSPGAPCFSPCAVSSSPAPCFSPCPSGTTRYDALNETCETTVTISTLSLSYSNGILTATTTVGSGSLKRLFIQLFTDSTRTTQQGPVIQIPITNGSGTVDVTLSAGDYYYMIKINDISEPATTSLNGQINIGLQNIDEIAFTFVDGYLEVRVTPVIPDFSIDFYTSSRHTNKLATYNFTNLTIDPNDNSAVIGRATDSANLAALGGNALSSEMPYYVVKINNTEVRSGQI